MNARLPNNRSGAQRRCGADGVLGSLARPKRKGLSVRDRGFWRIIEGFSVVVWYVLVVIYSFAYITHFGNTADQILPVPIPTWSLQAFIGMTGAVGGFMVGRYLRFYVVELLPAEDAAMKAMLMARAEA